MTLTATTIELPLLVQTKIVLYVGGNYQPLPIGSVVLLMSGKWMEQYKVYDYTLLTEQGKLTVAHGLHNDLSTWFKRV